MSPRTPSQLVPRFTGRQSWCISSDLVAQLDGRGKIGMPENLYENQIKPNLYCECSIELVGEIFLVQWIKFSVQIFLTLCRVKVFQQKT